jgi:hypothetical protein
MPWSPLDRYDLLPECGDEQAAAQRTLLKLADAVNEPAA